MMSDKPNLGGSNPPWVVSLLLPCSLFLFLLVSVPLTFYRLSELIIQAQIRLFFLFRMGAKAPKWIETSYQLLV